VEGAGGDGGGLPRDFLGGLEEDRLEAEEHREVGEGRVLVVVQAGGRGKTSGLELGHIGEKGAAVFCVHDDRVAKLTFYRDRERTLADLGLAPETRSQQS
jgi:hypothetical protein